MNVKKIEVIYIVLFRLKDRCCNVIDLFVKCVFLKIRNFYDDSSGANPREQHFFVHNSPLETSCSFHTVWNV